MSWEESFQSWGKPPGSTEQEMCDNAVRAIRKAVESSHALNLHNVTVFPQGSYYNRTNVRTDSDVDICVLCSDTIFFDLPSGKTASDFNITVPADYSFAEFKNDVESAMVGHFGRDKVKRGNKAFDIHENTYRVDADVVPCFDYKRFQDNGLTPKGTAFNQDRGGRVINWPDQNYRNGVGKNEATGRRFKSVVRILKHLRNDMDEAAIPAAKQISSFLIESLVWNVPNEGFGHGTLTADVRWTLAHLFNNTMNYEDCKDWTEVNDLKYLFLASDPRMVAQAHAFLSGAWDYVGFK